MPIRGRCFVASCLFALVTLVVPVMSGRADTSESMTPLLLAVHDAPVPFMGSDGQVHLVYELWMTNFSSGDIAIEKVEVLGTSAVLKTSAVLATLDAAAVASRLQPAGLRESTGTLGKSTQAMLFLNIALAPGAAIPSELSHRIAMRASAAPPDQQEFSESGGAVTVDRRSVVTIGPPLRGARYISADSCCDAVRHTRAALPINGRVWVAQRYAVDWEQLHENGSIYAGPREKLESYAIFGQPALAVADAVVESVTDGYDEQTPGKFPTNISPAEADGNSVILNLGDHRYALYAHLQPRTITVHPGERVKVGQVLGLVGDSGNSIVPHLHFQVTDGPSSLSSNGLPYEISDFQITGKTPGTAAFDEAESNGIPLAVTPVSPPQAVKGALPLDQLIISFASH